MSLPAVVHSEQQVVRGTTRIIVVPKLSEVVLDSDIHPEKQPIGEIDEDVQAALIDVVGLDGSIENLFDASYDLGMEHVGPPMVVTYESTDLTGGQERS